MTDMRDAVVSVEIPFAMDDSLRGRPHLALGWDNARAARYTDAVCAEIQAAAGLFDDCRICAVRLGGGVATMAGRGLAAIAAALHRALPMDGDVAVTATASVANISGATFPFFRRAGIGRFDFEMLSLNPANFTRLNRVDSLADFPVVCDHFLHAYANDSLGVTLAYGYEPATGEDAVTACRRSALAAARTRTAHVRLVPAGAASAAGPAEAKAQRAAMADALAGAGFAEYLPGLFAKPGREDRFALLENAGAPRIGFGAGARTRLDGAETRTTADLERYCAHSADFSAITEEAGPCA